MTIQDQVRKDYEKQHRNYEKRIRPIFLKVLRDQVDVVARWIELFNSNTPPLDEMLNSDVFIRPMVLSYELVGLTASRREYYFQKRTESKDISLLLDKWRELFRSYATNYAYRISNELNETTKEEIRKALLEGGEQNLSGTKMASYIRKKVGNQISRWRATLIARTEATTASNYAKEQGAISYFEEVGETGWQQWIGREDERERHDHFKLNNTYIPMGDQWNVGGELADMPGDTKLSGKQRIQCRCTRLFISNSLYERMRSRGQI